MKTATTEKLITQGQRLAFVGITSAKKTASTAVLEALLKLVPLPIHVERGEEAAVCRHVQSGQ